jgi:hypothetical protein
VATNDVSPYLQRPVRTLEEVIAEVEQQRLGTSAAIIVVIPPSTAGDASSADGSAVGKERV